MSTLLDSEMAAIRREVLDNVLDYGATPYIGVLSVYNVIQNHVISSTISPTTSATAVTVAGPTVLTLVSVSGLVAGMRVVIDTDDLRETVTIRAIVGSTVSVICNNLHSGTYPVEVESPLTLVRGILSDLNNIDTYQRAAPGTAGLRKADEVEWATGSESPLRTLAARRSALRMELASAAGIGWVLRDIRARNSGTSYEAY